MQHQGNQLASKIQPDVVMQNLAVLIATTATGDRPAFEALYHATSAKLFGVILLIIRDRGEAEELLQEVYVSIWRKAATFDCARGRPMTWLITIARYRAIDRLRTRRKGCSVDMDQIMHLADPSPPSDVLIFASRDARRLTAAMAKLPPRAAAAIRSAYLEGLAYDEIAARDNIRVNTLKSLVRRGLLQLRVEMTLADDPVLSSDQIIDHRRKVAATGCR